MCCAQLAWPAARPMHVPLLHESGGGSSLRSATAYQAPQTTSDLMLDLSGFVVPLWDVEGGKQRN